MAEKKEHKIVQAAPSTTPSGKTVVQAKESGSATGYRIGAIALWVAAIVFELLAVLIVFGKITWTFMPTLAQLIVLIVLDLACVIIGAQLWKKSNRIDPASEKNKVKFWLWNNMGVIACIVAFVPLVVILLSNKQLDKKTKAIATVVAIIALLIGGLCSIDWDPVSKEDKEAAVEALGDTEVYWTPFGKVYHTHEDCGSLNQTDTLTVGTVEQAIEANRTRLCAHCAKKDAISGVETDGSED